MRECVQHEHEAPTVSNAKKHFLRARSESGQATVEFALLLPVLLLVLLGMLDFGRAVNYYNTLTELAAEGARSAAVNVNPDGTAVSGTSIQNQIKCQAVSKELRSSATFHVNIASGTGGPAPLAAGQPVKVQATYSFSFIPFLKLGSVNLVGSATMRVEVASLSSENSGTTTLRLHTPLRSPLTSFTAMFNL
jgi:Flp pilus assembly protein TadG